MSLITMETGFQRISVRKRWLRNWELVVSGSHACLWSTTKGFLSQRKTTVFFENKIPFYWPPTWPPCKVTANQELQIKTSNDISIRFLNRDIRTTQNNLQYNLQYSVLNSFRRDKTLSLKFQGVSTGYASVVCVVSIFFFSGSVFLKLACCI